MKMKKPKGYWDKVSKLLFQNAVLIIVIRYLAFFAWRFDWLATGSAWGEWKYLFGSAVIAWVVSVAGQVYCLKEWEKEQSRSDQERSEE